MGPKTSFMLLRKKRLTTKSSELTTPPQPNNVWQVLLHVELAPLISTGAEVVLQAEELAPTVAVNGNRLPDGRKIDSNQLEHIGFSQCTLVFPRKSRNCLVPILLKQNSIAKSLSETASNEFIEIPSNFNFLATNFLSIG